jgi:hypothetical protein
MENVLLNGIWFADQKIKGGLGVLNLRLQNQALLMKNLYKFYNQYDIPWVNLIWRAYQYSNSTPHSGIPK